MVIHQLCIETYQFMSKSRARSINQNNGKENPTETVGNMFVDQMYILYDLFAAEPVLIGVVSVDNLTI